MPILDGIAGAPAGDGEVLCNLWITAEEVEECCEVSEDADLTAAILYASNVLYLASGSKFPGVCSLTFAPAICYPVCDGRLDLRKVTGGFPIVSIEEVRLNGDVLTANVDYRLDEGRWLTRLSQVGTWTTPWPTWQRTDIPIADMDFVVELTYGANPDEAGKQAAAAYACELAKACSSETSGECQLPEGVQNVVRDGITFSVVNPQDFLDNKNRTGIPKVDQWLEAVNPSGQTSRAFIMSPEDLSYGLVV